MQRVESVKMVANSLGGAQFAAYETIKGFYQLHVSPDMDIMPTLAMGALAQCVASTMTYPYQVIKARLQQGGASAQQYTGTWDCTKKILQYVVLLVRVSTVSGLADVACSLDAKATTDCSRASCPICSRSFPRAPSCSRPTSRSRAASRRYCWRRTDRERTNVKRKKTSACT